jgi:drug/metabolite transporter (DMT)-like permease
MPLRQKGSRSSLPTLVVQWDHENGNRTGRRNATMVRNLRRMRYMDDQGQASACIWNSMETASTPGLSAGISPTRQRFAGEAYILLVFTMVAWGGNAVAGRLAVGQVSPMVITCLRWGIVAIFLAGVSFRNLDSVLPELRRWWMRVTLMALCGFSFFNALFYVGAHHTTAVNIAILQGSTPIMVVIGAAVLYGARMGLLQMVGVFTTLIGVGVVATRGHLATLAAFELNLGDVLMLLGCVLYAAYTLALRTRPVIPALLFFSALAIVAFLTSLPLLAFEVVTGTVQWPTPEGWAIVAFIAIFPSFLSQLSFMRGVQLIGPSRAGLFMNLVPLFGAFFAVVILGEPFGVYHLVALVLIIGGILLAEAPERLRGYRRAAPGL